VPEKGAGGTAATEKRVAKPFSPLNSICGALLFTKNLTLLSQGLVRLQRFDIFPGLKAGDSYGVQARH
jgi:hypothetical protein